MASDVPDDTESRLALWTMYLWMFGAIAAGGAVGSMLMKFGVGWLVGAIVGAAVVGYPMSKLGYAALRQPGAAIRWIWIFFTAIGFLTLVLVWGAAKEVQKDQLARVRAPINDPFAKRATTTQPSGGLFDDVLYPEQASNPYWRYKKIGQLDEATWQEVYEQWWAANPEFVADPARVERMNAAIQFVHPRLPADATVDQMMREARALVDSAERIDPNKVDWD